MQASEGEEAEQSDWAPLLPTSLEVPQQSTRVDSRCSTSLDTWERANSLLYNVGLVAMRDRSPLGGPRLYCVQTRSLQNLGCIRCAAEPHAAACRLARMQPYVRDTQLGWWSNWAAPGSVWRCTRDS